MIEVSIFADEVSQDFSEAVSMCKRAGASGIELRGGIWGRSVQDCTDEAVARMKDLLVSHGSRVAVIGSPVGKCALGNEAEYETHVGWFDRMCELAHAFGTKIIRGFAFWTPTGRELPRPNLEDLLPEIAAKLTPLAERALAEDVYLCLESEGATCSGTCGEIARIIEAVRPNDNLMVAWDVNNAACLGEHPLREGYPLIRGRVKHVHVKPDSAQSIRTVWDTDVSYRQVFETLLADGYEGAATIEHWGSPALMLEGARQLGELLEELQGPSAAVK